MRGSQGTAWQRVLSRHTMREWRWVLIISAAALLLSSVPYLAGYLASSPEMSFGGAVINIEDANSNLMEMQQGARGMWRYYLLFTPEPHRATFFPPFYVMLGHMARWFHLSLPTTYQLARLVLGLGVLLATYRFGGLFLDRVVGRRIAFVLMAFSSGLGWLVVLFVRPGPEGISPIDFWFMDAYLFFSILTFPHFSFSIVCLIGVFGGVLRYLERNQWQWLAVISICSLLLAVVHPFMSIVVDAALLIYVLFLWQQQSRIPWSAALPIGLAGLLPLPLLAQMLISTNQDPVLRSFQAQNVTPSPPPGYFLAGYGLLLLLALPVLGRALRRGKDHQRFLVSWLVAVILLVYAPFALQRRVVEGVHVALCILAADGLVSWWLPAIRRSRFARFVETRFHYSPRRLRTFALNTLLGLSAISNLYLVAGLATAAATQNPLLFHTQAQNQAIEWLATHSDPMDTILSGFATGNYIPARIGHRVFVGHAIETADYQNKVRTVNDLFAGNLGDETVQAVLDQYNIAYVYLGPEERGGRRWDADSKPYLARQFHQDDISIYQVRLDGGQ